MPGLCRCGRQITRRPHCPFCGSRNVYSRQASDGVFETENGQITARGFHCRGCSLNFNEGWLCEAPSEAGVDSRRHAESSKATAEKFKASIPNRQELEDAILKAAKLARKKKEDDTDENLEDIFKKAEDDARENDGKAN